MKPPPGRFVAGALGTQDERRALFLTPTRPVAIEPPVAFEVQTEAEYPDGKGGAARRWFSLTAPLAAGAQPVVTGADGAVSSPALYTRVQGAQGRLRGPAVGRVRFGFARRAEASYTHLGGRLEERAGLYTRRNHFAWMRRGCDYEVSALEAEHLGGGQVRVRARTSEACSLAVLVLPRDVDFSRGARANIGAATAELRSEHEFTFRVPPGEWRVLAVAGRETTVGHTSPLTAETSCYEPLYVSPVRRAGRTGQVDVVLGRPGVCVVAVVDRPQALTTAGNGSPYVVATSPHPLVLLSAAWVGGQSALQHTASFPLGQGASSLLTFGTRAVVTQAVTTP